MGYDYTGTSEALIARMAVREVSIRRLAEAMEVRGYPITPYWLGLKIKEPHRFDLGELGAICDILGLNLGELVTAKASA